MRDPFLALAAFALFLTFSLIHSERVVAATDDQNLTGLGYLPDGTPLAVTAWADGTGFAVWVNHEGSWATSWRHPATGWYLTSGGAYSIVLPAPDKEVNWANDDPYRVEFDVSAITGNPGERDNATSHGSGDPGEFTPIGASSNTIVWNATDNWQRWDVILLAPAIPDFAILAGDVTATPSTVEVGQLVQLEATVRNVGNGSADGSVAVFLDADADQYPDPAEILDQPPVSLDAGETTTLSYIWAPGAVGTYTFCAYADPSDVLLETNEGNNVDCTDVLVQTPQETRADYFPTAPLPMPPIRAGLSQPLSFSVEVRNQGNATGTSSSVLAFFNTSTPGSPFVTFSVPTLQPAETSSRFAATWTSPATAGTYDVTAEADRSGVLVEWNEANNAITWTVDVVSGPVTNLVLGAPNLTAVKTSVTSLTDLSFSVLDQSGVGIDSTWYRVDNTTWTNYSSGGPFRLSGEGGHFVEWYSDDLAGNVEAVQSTVLVVDDTPPTTTPTIGDPKYLVGGTFVTSTTPIALAATDGGADPVGLASVEYRVDAGGWSPYTLEFSIAGEGAHSVSIRASDLLGNTPSILTFPITVDDTAPTLSLAVATPQYAGPQLFVKSSTPLTIIASDEGPIPVGLASVESRIDDGAWTPSTNPFRLPPSDGDRHVEYAATDHLGNRASDARDVVVDDTPPGTTIAPVDRLHTQDTIFTLFATDAGSGVAHTDSQIDDQGWTLYSGGFALQAGNHTVRYRSVDRLNNTEPERTLTVTIEGAPPSVPEPNWKPLVAAAFSATLAIVGVWSAWRVPARTLSRPRVRAFVLAALPFIVIEESTGIVSLLTGWLSIPPILGLGTAVDGAILIAGVAVLVRRVRKGTPPK